MLRSIFAFGLMGVAAVMLPERANAQASFVCGAGPGPGERQIGLAGGGPGVAATPICITDEGPAPDAPPPEEPANLLGDAAKAMFGAFSATRAEMERMKNDPRYRQYMEGEWKFYDDMHHGEKVCGVAFARQGQVILIHGPAAHDKAAAMSFIDFRDDAMIPSPKQEKKIKVTLTQNNESPQTVVAINNTGPSGEGMILLGVPRMDAVVENIDDAMTFKVEIEGKIVVDTAWHDGRKAQDFLRKCVGL